ncbi:MAG: isoprenyl transferase [Micromonosporaceae bacterium]
MKLSDLLYSIYERRLRRRLSHSQTPRHIGVMLDGNRRWARSVGLTNPNEFYQAGAAKVEQFLSWCDEAGVELVTLWLLSTDNLNRESKELAPLLQVIEGLATELAADANPWRLRIVGNQDMLPTNTAEALKAAEERTRDRTGGAQLNIAVGYGGRQEIADAVRSLLQQHAKAGTSIEELAELLDVDHIADHLYTKGQPDPDLIIRTRGEQRLSGFLLWQSAHSEFYFCEAYWPDFRRVDFLRAIRSYASRHRRYGN